MLRRDPEANNLLHSAQAKAALRAHRAKLEEQFRRSQRYVRYELDSDESLLLRAASRHGYSRSPSPPAFRQGESFGVTADSRARVLAWLEGVGSGYPEDEGEAEAAVVAREEGVGEVPLEVAVLEEVEEHPLDRYMADGENQEGDTGVLLQGVSATYHGVYDSDETVTIFY